MFSVKHCHFPFVEIREPSSKWNSLPFVSGWLSYQVPVWEWVIFKCQKRCTGSRSWRLGESLRRADEELTPRGVWLFDSHGLKSADKCQLRNTTGWVSWGFFFGKYGSFLFFFRVIQLSKIKNSEQLKKWLNRCRPFFPFPQGPTS